MGDDSAVLGLSDGRSQGPTYTTSSTSLDAEQLPLLGRRGTAEDSTASGLCLRAGRANVALFSDFIVESHEPMTLTPARHPRVILPCSRTPTEPKQIHDTGKLRAYYGFCRGLWSSHFVNNTYPKGGGDRIFLAPSDWRLSNIIL